MAEVLVDGKSINAGLVKAGWAWADKRYATGENGRQMIKLEEKAREAKRGLWKLNSPVAPWDWRRQQKEKNVKEK